MPGGSGWEERIVGGLQAEATGRAAERSGRAQVLEQPLCGRAGGQGPSATVPVSALHKGCHCSAWSCLKLGLFPPASAVGRMAG